MYFNLQYEFKKERNSLLSQQLLFPVSVQNLQNTQERATFNFN